MHTDIVPQCSHVRLVRDDAAVVAATPDRLHSKPRSRQVMRQSVPSIEKLGFLTGQSSNRRSQRICKQHESQSELSPVDTALLLRDSMADIAFWFGFGVANSHNKNDV